MASERRGISTVVDVSLALVLLVGAMGVLVAFAETDQREHEPVDTEYTTQAVAGSTTNVSYTVSDAIQAHFRDHMGTSNPYDAEELERTSHGPLAALVADVAVANVTVGGEQVSNETAEYEHALEEELQTRLLGSQFETSIVATWLPLDGADLQGTVTLGEQPPPDADVSTTTITVANGVPDAREAAVEGVDGPRAYGAVAGAVANATIAGLFPELETQRALERTGVDYHLTRYRYERFAMALDGNRSVLESEGWVDPSSADASAANAYLGAQLAAMLQPQLEAHHGEKYENATEAAQAVSTDTVTITIRTWTDD